MSEKWEIRNNTQRIADQVFKSRHTSLRWEHDTVFVDEQAQNDLTQLLNRAESYRTSPRIKKLAELVQRIQELDKSVEISLSDQVLQLSEKSRSPEDGKIDFAKEEALNQLDNIIKVHTWEKAIQLVVDFKGEDNTEVSEEQKTERKKQLLQQLIDLFAEIPSISDHLHLEQKREKYNPNELLSFLYYEIMRMFYNSEGPNAKPKDDTLEKERMVKTTQYNRGNAYDAMENIFKFLNDDPFLPSNFNFRISSPRKTNSVIFIV